ncbi:hypothetical protein GCM10007898_25290 [Dyella flagellata]|uniref:Uncharacterized protein n=1 Tax=Dyella flagellata TaxID=1867833 RepID=A0ABQ5XCW8_9GAMM|nr:hypothetical protein GCM10007898_25290 [Dyella flagellata]
MQPLSAPDDMPAMAASIGMARETTGISTINAMAAKASHAANLCWVERFNTPCIPDANRTSLA